MQTRRRGGLRWRWPLAGLCLLALAAGIYYETKTSDLQSFVLSRLGRKLTFQLAAGPSDSILFPDGGPFDTRRGYTFIPQIVNAMAESGHTVSAQARWSPWLLSLTRLGAYPIYHRKPQASLILRDSHGAPLYSVSYPQRVYADYDSIPALAVQTLLFIENRELFKGTPYRNPAVEWDRLVKAGCDYVLGVFNPHRGQSGGSTLATQLEKYQHSPQGFTGSPVEKLRQMLSASLRSYRDGRNTLPARRHIVCEYVNSVPLAAAPGYGEVIGLGDGLWAWFDQDFARTNRLLRATSLTRSRDVIARATAYKQVLSLFIAHRRPSMFLISDRRLLEEETNQYLRLLAQAGIIDIALRDAALRIPLRFRETSPIPTRPSYIEKKAANAVRTQLLSLLKLDQLYTLDRIDLTAGTTLDGPVERRLTNLLERLKKTAVLDSLGLRGPRLLERGSPAGVIYSFTLYEATPFGNLLRLQADNYDQPLDINEGAKLDLGSSAKLRTLANYLEIVATLHRQHAGQPRDSLRAAERRSPDPIRRWACAHLASAKDTTLAPMLEAALNRRYSADPHESFFTGSGLHTFSNFDDKFDDQILSVREGFRHSINLVFIRLMRDIVRYYQQEIPDYDPAMLEDRHHAQRREYLERFADKEAKQFLGEFHRKYSELTPDECLHLLATRIKRSARRLTTLFRSARPQAGQQDLAAFLQRYLTEPLSADDVASLYERYGPETYDLHDRSYIVGVDPMELWLVSYLQEHPRAGWGELVAASTAARQEAYRWLFDTKSSTKQNKRIRIMLEEASFALVHEAWQRLGYPFESFVPSYASAIGSSGDRPAALAELVGIIVNDGLRLPARRLEYLHFAEDTPFETHFDYAPAPGERVLPSAVARALRGTLIDVVENGTARRCYQAFRLPNGKAIAVGGKTGTGDHRYETFGRGGQLLKSRVIDRSATFVFLIGDRFFGVITAYVGGPQAGSYGFTSSLPVHLLAALAPELMPLIRSSLAEQPPAPRRSSH